MILLRLTSAIMSTFVLSVTGLQNNGSVHTENKASVKGMWHSKILFFNEHECQSYETCVKTNIFQESSA